MTEIFLGGLYEKDVLFTIFAVLCGVFALSPVEASAAARQKTVLMVLPALDSFPALTSKPVSGPKSSSGYPNFSVRLVTR